MGQPGLFFIYFQSFQTNNKYNFYNKSMWKMAFPSSILCQDLNPRPLKHESSSMTTRPGLLLNVITFYISKKWVTNLFWDNSSIATILCSHLRWEGIPRAALRGRDHQRLLWAGQPDGQVWPTPWQVHGLLHALPWWCRAQGCQCCNCYNQDQAVHPICGLVPNWIQSWHQLSGKMTDNLNVFIKVPS